MLHFWTKGVIMSDFHYLQYDSGEPPFFAQPSKADLSAYDSELHLINIAPLDPVTARQPL